MINLQEVRKSRNLTQKQVAEDNKINVATYCTYETGRYEPDIETLKKIADYFDVSLDYLCGRQNKNIVPLDSLSEPKRQVIQELRALTDDQALMLLGYIARIKERPIEEIIAKIKNTD